MPTQSLTPRDPRVAKNRALYEFYPTPPIATEALLSVEKFDGSIWEPACGKGHIATVLHNHGYDVVPTDLVDWGFPHLYKKQDFLKATEPLAKHIVTNPPYGRGLADQFVLKALQLTATTGGSVAMLLNLKSLAHPKRHRELWTKYRPSVVYVLDDLHCTAYGDTPQSPRRTYGERYAWVVWKPSYGKSETILRFLTTAQSR